MQKPKRFMSVVIVLAIMLSAFSIFSIPTSAANITVSASASGPSQLMVERKVTFTKLSTNKITVVNKGNVNMFVYIDNIYKSTLSPGREYTFAQYGWKAKNFNVKVYSQNRGLGKQSITIKTTSGSISKP